VDASDYGYSRLQMPDSGLMLLTYGATAALAMAGPADRARCFPALPLALAAKTASLLSLALALPEAARALPALTGRRAARARR
jgi:hypothetical protein